MQSAIDSSTEGTGKPERGGWREVLRLALPLILANSFWTLQITIDRVMLSWYSSDALAAAMPAAMVFWTLLTLLQSTCAYATTFVAQYFGAARYHRVGPAVWQGIYFALGGGMFFLALIPLAPVIVTLGGHSPAIQALEHQYLIPLAYSALPALILAAVTGFFNGRGDTSVVIWLNGIGLAVNAVLDYFLIFGHGGFPEMGIAGAGWATVAGSWASALLALGLMFRKHFREKFATASGWRFDAPLFGRLMRFGLPSGLQWFMDGLVFTIFTFLIGRMGDAELGATSVAITLNLLAVLPAVGMGQAVSVLVGQRLGENRPDLAERSTWSGFWVAWIYMACVALVYLFLPHWLLGLFRSDAEPEKWAAVEALTVKLLWFVAFYCLFDSMNLVFSFALKGAGDTRFVTIAATILAWPVVVLPSWLAYEYEWGALTAWGFASAYVIALGFIFLARFRAGYWKDMRVIEEAPVVELPGEGDEPGQGIPDEGIPASALSAAKGAE